MGEHRPRYELIESRGAAHARAFLVAAHAGEHDFPSAWGRTRKEAERWAAFEAFARVGRDRTVTESAPTTTLDLRSEIEAWDAPANVWRRVESQGSATVGGLWGSAQAFFLSALHARATSAQSDPTLHVTWLVVAGG